MRTLAPTRAWLRRHRRYRRHVGIVDPAQEFESGQSLTGLACGGIAGDALLGARDQCVDGLLRTAGSAECKMSRCFTDPPVASIVEAHAV